MYSGLVIRLDYGESAFQQPVTAKAEVIRHINNEENGYAPILGDAILKAKIIQFLTNKFGLEAEPDQISIVSGGLMGINSVLNYLVKEKNIKHLFYPNPGFPPYSKLEEYHMIEGLTYDFSNKKVFMEEIRYISKNFKDAAIIICSPNNPNGLSLNENEWKMVFELQKELTIICDDSFENYYFYNNPIVSLCSNCYRVFSFSKSFSLADFRIGFVVSSEKKSVEYISKYNWDIHLSTSMIAQKAAIGALNSLDYQEKCKEFVEKQVMDAAKLFIAADITCSYPEGGYFLWLKIPDKYNNSMDFSIDLLNRKRVQVIPGEYFGDKGEHYFRINCSTNWLKLKEGIERIIDLY